MSTGPSSTKPAEVRSSQRFGAGEWLVAFLAGSVLYTATMAPGLLWGDHGEAQLRVLQGQILDPLEVARAHSPYYVVAVGLHLLLGGSAAFAANLVAALAGAITVANVAALTRLFVRRAAAVLVAAALLGLSHSFWIMSSGAEVMTFATACTSAELLCLALFMRTRSVAWLAGAAFLNGLGWSTHNFAILIWPAYMLLALVEQRHLRRAGVGAVLGVAGAWLLGALPILVLFVREWIVLGSVGPAVASLFVGRYSDQVLNTQVSVGSLLRVAAIFALNFPTPLLLVAGWGAWRLWRDWPWRHALFLTIAGLGFFGFTVRYNVPDQHTFFLHTWLFIALLAGIGADVLLERVPKRTMAVLLVLLALPAPLVYAVLPSLARRVPQIGNFMPKRELPYRDSFKYFLQPWRTGYGGAERYARELLGSLPPNAILFADETALRPLDYLQAAEDVRSDVTILDSPYRQRIARSLEVDERNAAEYVQAGRLFSVSNLPIYAPQWALQHGYRFEPFGFIFRIEMPSRAPVPSTAPSPS